MTLEQVSVVVAGFAAAASAVFAGVELRLNRKSALRRASFDFLREVHDKSLACANVDAGAARAEVLAYYQHKQASLSEDARRYMDHLTTLDRMLCAVATKDIDEDLLRPWLRDLWRPHEKLLTFIEEVQAASGNDSLLEFLLQHLRVQRRKLKESE